MQFFYMNQYRIVKLKVQNSCYFNIIFIFYINHGFLCAFEIKVFQTCRLFLLHVVFSSRPSCYR